MSVTACCGLVVDDGGSGGEAGGVAALVQSLQERGHIVLFIEGGDGASGGGGDRGWGSDVTAVLQLEGTPPAVEDAADVLVLVEPNKKSGKANDGDGDGDDQAGDGGCAFSGGADRSDGGGGAKEKRQNEEEGNGPLSRLASAISLARTVAFDYEAFQAEVSCQVCTLA